MQPIFITGVSTGIGHDMARVLIFNNLRVVGTVRDPHKALELKNEFGALFEPIVVDINDYQAVDQLPGELKKLNIHSLSVLVNNAGIAVAAPFIDQPFKEIESILRTNVLSLMKVTQVLTPLLAAARAKQLSAHHQKDQSKSSLEIKTDLLNKEVRPKIINISSISGKSAAPFLSVYAASKHAIEGFSEGLRKEYMKIGIDVVVIGPGSIKTPIWEKGFIIIKEAYKKSIYADSFDLFIKMALDEQNHALEVKEISNLVLRIISHPNPSFRYDPIPRKWFNWYLSNLIPAKIYNRLTAKALKLNESIDR